MTLFGRIKPAAAWLALLVTGLLLLQSPALAQETSGTVSGVVQDTTDALIRQETWVWTDLQNKTGRTTVSNSEGRVTIASVASGPQFQLTVSSPGFMSGRTRMFGPLPGDRPII